MSAAAGIAGKVIPMLPKLAGMLPMAKGALNIGKKVVGGIKNIFGRKMSGGEETGENQVIRSGIGGMIDQGKQFASSMGGMINSGREIYQGFREGGIGGGIGAFREQMPQMRENIGGMIDSGKFMYQQGQNMLRRRKGASSAAMPQFG